MKKILILLVLFAGLFLFGADSYYRNNVSARITTPTSGDILSWNATYRAWLNSNSLAITGDITTTGDVSGAMITNTALQTTTLGTGAVTFALTSNSVTLTGDGAANTLGTITGAGIGIYVILFVDANITITDTDAHTADTIDLVGNAANLTSADDTTLTIFYNGTSFYELSRSVN